MVANKGAEAYDDDDDDDDDNVDCDKAYCVLQYLSFLVIHLFRS